MRIFDQKKTKNDITKKKTIQEWLRKIVAPERLGRIIPAKLKKIRAHIHSIEGKTARARGHQEDVSASTGNPIMTKDGHMHEYSGAVFVEGKRVHRLEGITGSTSGQGRDHTHMIAGQTSRDGSHSHKYSMETSNMLSKQQKTVKPDKQKPKTVISSGSTAKILPSKNKG